MDYNVDDIFGAQGTGPGLFNTPSKIDVDEAGDIYVLDKGSKSIKVFASDKTRGQIHSIRPNINPLDLDVKPGVLLVGSNTVSRLYTNEGEYIESIYPYEDLENPEGDNEMNVAFDTKSDDIYMSLRSQDILSKFSKEG